ncbi:surface composition regulator [Salmonella enterica subsp. enterica serovar Choleraesuis]|nr:surface composition regulator [Salmonella enterica subsp. enterica serovar Choleraesuis]
MNQQDVNALKNFDFLASSFAHMSERGQAVDLKAVTGNMSAEQKAWFQQRYEFYLKHPEEV